MGLLITLAAIATGFMLLRDLVLFVLKEWVQETEHENPVRLIGLSILASVELILGITIIVGGLIALAIITL